MFLSQLLKSSLKSVLISWLIGIWALHTSPHVVADDGLAFFESRIRPLLVERCIECHGELKQEGNLRLDSKAGWQAGGDQGAVIVAKDQAESRLMTAVRYADKSLQMPPSKKLSDREIEDLATWIELGAPDPRDGVPTPKASEKPLWSLKPLADAKPPELEGNLWSAQPLDLFVLEKLRAKGLEPSPPAERRTWLRRVTFDLTGLPPTLAEVEAFERDTSVDAFEKVVDRLLNSPHYGEQWARHWLDIARYSDTKGYMYAREEKRWVHAATYRDWVVQALNSDMPYDRFVRLQIAADQIEPPGSPHLAAMGYLTIGRRFLGVTHDIIDDRIDVVTRGMLGMTVACARCHDHKYDPIPTRDYYALYGVFQSSAEQLVPCGISQDETVLEELEKRKKKLRETMATRREEQAARNRARVKEHLLAQLELEKYPEEVFSQLLDENDLNPVFVRKWQAYLAKDARQDMPIFAKWHALLKSNDVSGLHAAAAEYGTQFTEIEKQWRELLAKEPSATALPSLAAEQLRQVLYAHDSPCTVPDEHIANIEFHFPIGVTTELWKNQAEVDRWLLDNPSAPPHATILFDRPQPATPRVFLRGNPLTKGAEESRHFLTALKEVSGGEVKQFLQGSGRLELADSIADPNNPLTARVMVNRVWMHHFGRGLVNTPSDFGHRAEQPTHPELLDWLSRKFIDSGWRLKDLHRTLVLSQTYRQDSRGPLEAQQLALALQTDPDNHWLWRMTEHRLSFEEARDAWLAASGELDLLVGGRPLPLFGQQNVRRTLYAYVDREDLSPILRMFDFANPDLSIAQRNSTTVPQQALFAMNHPFIAQRVAKLTSSIVGADTVASIERLYAALYQRRPTALELQLATKFIQTDPATSDAGSMDAAEMRASRWSYGYGEFDVATGKVVGFTPLPHFSGTAWQGGSSFPDPTLGWVQLSAAGGHPGNDLKHAVVRRWTAPVSGKFRVRSKLIHEPAVGDGIRAFVSHSRRGLLRSATVHHSSEAIDVEALETEVGDTIDFVVDIREGLNSDQFLWSPEVALESLAGTGTASPQHVWNSEADFRGPASSMLDRWGQLAQVLMLANEFMFVD
ncbi:MAG: PSD1 and planctomycete cytochrome C domain-containing protein [Pirellulaceae bacterium]|nr:PSD1 and planctomycete cytochrome C domain-containing protein [Pirellulaceae bacterium]